MTTAHRPTFEPARGGTGRNEGDLAKLSQQYSSKDMPSHTKLKYRQKGQSHIDDVRSKVSLASNLENATNLRWKGGLQCGGPDTSLDVLYSLFRHDLSFFDR